MAVDGRIRDEVVEVRVVREPSRIDHCRRVVHQLPEEAEGVLLRESRRSELSDLHLERLRLVVQRPDGSVQLRFDELQRALGREPSAQRLAWCLPEVPQLCVLRRATCGAS